MDWQYFENLFIVLTGILAFLSAIFYVFNMLSGKTVWLKTGYTGLVLSFLTISGILFLRTVQTGHAPLSNFFESFIFTVWGLILIYFILERIYKTNVLGVFLSSFVGILMIVAYILPPKLKKAASLMPALQSYWLQIHVSVVMISYSVFALSFITALIYFIYSYSKKEIVLKRNKQEFLNLFDELTYRLVLLGLPLLGMGIITGSIWANYAWGTYWSWDPKEVWSLITWLVYTIYLHARFLYKVKGKIASILALIGFVAIIITYYGVNYLSNSLHSYGL